MTLVLILLFIGLLSKIFRTKQAISMHQTRIFIYFESTTLYESGIANISLI